MVKFEGCYHGHADALLVKAGSGVATFGIPGSAGVPDEFTQFTFALPYNDLRRALRRLSPSKETDRLRDRRAGGWQYGLCAAARGIPGGPSA